MTVRKLVLVVSLWGTVSACGDPGYELDGGADTVEQNKVKPSDKGGSGGSSGQGVAGAAGARDGSAGRAGSAGAQAGSGGKGGADSSATPAGRGGGGGSAAAGRAGSTPAGSGGSSGSGVNGLGDPAACAPCEDKFFPKDSTCYGARKLCSSATGTAARGPKAGAPKAQLCTELISCIWRTGCGAGTISSATSGTWSNCFCEKGVDCIADSLPPKGPCKDEVFAAVETTDLGQVPNRLNDPLFASGLAIQVADCDSIFCSYECGICIPEGAADPVCKPQSQSNDADGGV